MIVFNLLAGAVRERSGDRPGAHFGVLRTCFERAAEGEFGAVEFGKHHGGGRICLFRFRVVPRSDTEDGKVGSDYEVEK